MTDRTAGALADIRAAIPDLKFYRDRLTAGEEADIEQAREILTKIRRRLIAENFGGKI